MPMTLSSPAFKAGGEIPSQYTCEGKNISPALEWSGVPAGAQSLAVLVSDPDAPDPAAPLRTFIHWVLYDLPSSVTGLPPAAMRGDLPPGSQEGLNDFKRRSYSGPCPPIGRHRFFFRLFALDTLLPQLRQPTGRELQEAMEGHVLATAELMGTYQKKAAPVR